MIFGSDCERGDFWSGLTAGFVSDGVACGEAAATRCTPCLRLGEPCRTYFGGPLKRSPPSERGRSSLPPRTAARVMPASRAEYGTARPSCPLLCGGSRPLYPQDRLRHIVPLALVPHTRHERRRQSCPGSPQVLRQPSRPQVVTPPAFATRRGCGSNSLPKPGRKWGLGKRIALSFSLVRHHSICHPIA